MIPKPIRNALATAMLCVLALVQNAVAQQKNDFSDVRSGSIGEAAPVAANDGPPPEDMPDMKLAPDQPGSRIVGARDFSYDRSGLPHYPNGVDKRVRRDGRFIERLGFYNPTAKGGEEGLRIAQDRLAYWVGVGAQSSPTVDRLIKQAAKAVA